jgi:mannosyl-oligosaccharide glucosidase
MPGTGRRSTRSRVNSSKHANANDDDDDDGVSLRRRPNLRRARNDSSIRIFNVDLKIILGLSVVAFFAILFLIYNLINPVQQAQMPRVVTPFPAPKLMDLPQVWNVLLYLDYYCVQFLR